MKMKKHWNAECEEHNDFKIGFCTFSQVQNQIGGQNQCSISEDNTDSSGFSQIAHLQYVAIKLPVLHGLEM